MRSWAYNLGEWLVKRATSPPALKPTSIPTPKPAPIPPPVFPPVPTPDPVPMPLTLGVAEPTGLQKFRKYLTPFSVTDKNRETFGGWSSTATPYPELFRRTGTTISPMFESKLKPLPAVPFSTLESIATRMSPTLYERVYATKPDSLRVNVAKQVLPILGKPNLDVSEAESPLGQAVKSKLTRQPPRAPFYRLTVPTSGFLNYRTGEIGFPPAAGGIRSDREVSAPSVLAAALRGGGILSHESEHSQRETLPSESNQTDYATEADIASNKKFEDYRVLASGGEPRTRTPREVKAFELLRRMRAIAPAEELGAVTAEWSILADAVRRAGGDPYNVKIKLNPKAAPISLGRILEETSKRPTKRMSELWDNPAGRQYLMNLNRDVLEDKQEKSDLF